ncbi:MAG: PilN domain-containing protein [Hylemonella sp.]
MAQQINLCTPLFLAPRRYFSAQTMAQALAVFVLLGGALSAYWGWTLQRLGAQYERAVAAHQREIEQLQAALARQRELTAPADAALIERLKTRQQELARREELLAQLQQGLLREGQGHAARLQLIARTIPAQAWVTAVRAQDQRLELSGYTTEPAALNGWMQRLNQSELLQGQVLAAVKVERVAEQGAGTGAAQPVLSRIAAPLWSFTLVTTLPQAADREGKP